MDAAAGKAFPLRGKRVVLGVCGGIAAYKAAELTRLLVTAGAEVRVVMTRAAREFVTPMTFQTLSGKPVGTDLFDLTQESEIGHIRLAQDADLVIVAPATADAIARLAGGMADDLLTTLALVTRAPILLAPAMNVLMWEHPLVRENVDKLRSMGHVHVVGPGSGFLACRMTGPGRLAEPADIAEAASRLLTPQDLADRHVVVTAGPTHEPIDPVRFVGNRSSGKQGYAFARAAAARGARVTLVSGPSALPEPLGVEVVRVGTAVEMLDAATSRALEADLVVMSAAIADYRPDTVAARKLKKDDVGDSLRIELVRNPDVLAGLAAARRDRGDGRPVLVGFAAETDRVEESARKKLASKGCDVVVANDVSDPTAGFEVDTNKVTLIGPGDAVTELPLMSKDAVAHEVLDRVVPLLGKR